MSRNPVPGEPVEAGDDRQPADPGQRRRALVLVAVAALLGALLISQWPALLAAAERWIVRDPARQGARLRLLLVALWLLAALPLLAFATSLWRLARRTAVAGRFPPPGSAVVRPVQACHGRDARRIAVGVRLLVLLLIGALLALVAILVRLAALIPVPPLP